MMRTRGARELSDLLRETGGRFPKGAMLNRRLRDIETQAEGRQREAILHAIYAEFDADTDSDLIDTLERLVSEASSAEIVE